MKFFSTALLLVITTLANAGPPALVDPQTGKYLGNLSSNPYDQNSTSNPYGQYGSPYSNDSPNNPYATGSPVYDEYSDQ